jgi:hypothetical protein
MAEHKQYIRCDQCREWFEMIPAKYGVNHFFPPKTWIEIRRDFTTLSVCSWECAVVICEGHETLEEGHGQET